MKKPEEIKKGLECCSTGCADDCFACPYGDAEIGRVDDHCIEQLLRDSLARNQQLEAQVSKWIPVEEMLPPNDDAVLIIVHNKSDAWTSVMIDVWDGGVWLDNADDDWHIVTHWMPLPEAPKEDAHD